MEAVPSTRPKRPPSAFFTRTRYRASSPGRKSGRMLWLSWHSPNDSLRSCEARTPSGIANEEGIISPGFIRPISIPRTNPQHSAPLLHDRSAGLEQRYKNHVPPLRAQAMNSRPVELPAAGYRRPYLPALTHGTASWSMAMATMPGLKSCGWPRSSLRIFLRRAKLEIWTRITSGTINPPITI